MKTSLAVASLLGLGVSAQPWDYSQNGNNWKTDYDGCGIAGGSPINLSSDLSKYTQIDVSAMDNLSASFTNLSPATVEFKDFTT